MPSAKLRSANLPVFTSLVWRGRGTEFGHDWTIVQIPHVGLFFLLTYTFGQVAFYPMVIYDFSRPYTSLSCQYNDLGVSRSSRTECQKCVMPCMPVLESAGNRAKEASVWNRCRTVYVVPLGQIQSLNLSFQCHIRVKVKHVACFFTTEGNRYFGSNMADIL